MGWRKIHFASKAKQIDYRYFFWMEFNYVQRYVISVAGNEPFSNFRMKNCVKAWSTQWRSLSETFYRHIFSPFIRHWRIIAVISIYQSRVKRGQVFKVFLLWENEVSSFHLRIAFSWKTHKRNFQCFFWAY